MDIFWNCTIQMNQQLQIVYHYHKAEDREHFYCKYTTIIHVCHIAIKFVLIISMFRFFPGLFLYCVVGALINKGAGKSGKELMPHSKFWSNLPGLISVRLLS